MKKETRIFAGNIPVGTTDEEIINYFSKWGTVIKVVQPAAGTSGKGYAFITFSSVQEKIAALSVKPHEIKGVELRVVEAKPKPSGPSSPFYPPFQFEIQDPSVIRDEYEENPTRLFVGRLPAEITKEELRDYFSTFGQVADVFRPPSQPTSTDPKGYAFVTFRETKELWRALAGSPHILKDHKIEVVEARPKTARGPSSLNTGTEPRVFVGRIPIDAPETEVKSYFAKFGNVVDVYRPKQNQKEGFYFAFVIFESSTDVAKVLCEEHHSLPNRNSQLNVLRARPRIPGITTAAAKSAIASAFYRLPTDQPSPYADFSGQFVEGNPYLMDPYAPPPSMGYDMEYERYAPVSPPNYQQIPVGYQQVSNGVSLVSTYGPALTGSYGQTINTGKQHRYAPY